jgi:hypothetical protein
MRDGQIFLKNLSDTSFNKDLSNEPTFGRIHLDGQYLALRPILNTDPDLINMDPGHWKQVPVPTK